MREWERKLRDTRCLRQKGGAWRTTRVLAARSSFVSHSGAALGSESSGMKKAGTEDPPFLRAVSWCTVGRRTAFYFATFRAVASRRWPTLCPSLSLSLLEPLFLNKERHALLSENRNRGELVLKTDQWQFLTFLNFSRMSLSNRNN